MQKITKILLLTIIAHTVHVHSMGLFDNLIDWLAPLSPIEKLEDSLEEKKPLERIPIFSKLIKLSPHDSKGKYKYPFYCLFLDQLTKVKRRKELLLNMKNAKNPQTLIIIYQEIISLSSMQSQKDEYRNKMKILKNEMFQEAIDAQKKDRRLQQITQITDQMMDLEITDLRDDIKKDTLAHLLEKRTCLYHGDLETYQKEYETDKKQEYELRLTLIGMESNAEKKEMMLAALTRIK